MVKVKFETQCIVDAIKDVAKYIDDLEKDNEALRNKENEYHTGACDRCGKPGKMVGFAPFYNRFTVKAYLCDKCFEEVDGPYKEFWGKVNYGKVNDENES